MATDLDPLGLLANRRRASIRLGAAEAGPGMVHVTISNRINRMPDASVELDLDLLTQPADYFGALTIAAAQQDARHPLFSGTVITAQPDGRRVRLEAQGGASFAETFVGEMAASAVTAAELVYTLARGAGFEPEQLNVEGLDRMATEMFEVLAPVRGLVVAEKIDFAGVRLIPGVGVIERLRRTLDASDELWRAFDSPAYALVLVSHSLCLDAEESALASIDFALAWLTVRLRYGLADLPDKVAVPFVRAESLAIPQRGELVLIRGLTTSRRWLRQPQNLEAERQVTLDLVNPRFAVEVPSLTLQERLAIQALARATAEPDLLARVHALFEAIEFYTSGTSMGELFTKAERQELVVALPGLTDKQRARVVDLFSQLNNAPLRIRLMKALDEDRVPLARNADVDLLWALRDLRNDVTHGRSSEMPALHDVEHATSIVARMLVFRVARRLREARISADGP